ncbi:glycine zipper 2TM domain-containing protein [Sphingomonas tabacisoli]|uniref:17 kDa surface antigen n=1 Tax=Sphingomonas tabacisoli TaxID=2249466 RepID=A0ABW4HYP9_9SPHN
MRKFVLAAALGSTLLPSAAALAQPVPPPPSRYDDRRYDDRYYDDRSVADMDAAQRRFDAAQARFDRERDIYERERQAYQDTRARYEAERERLASRAYDGPTWRGNDGQTYCKRKDGTVGTIIGGVAGALLGRAVDGGRNRAVGTIIGGGAGALAGRAVEQGSTPPECR